MTAPKHSAAAQSNPSDLGLDQFEEVDDEQGLSLDELSQTYAKLLSRGDDPYSVDDAAEDEEETEAAGTIENDVAAGEAAEADRTISPRSILEAILFVGHPENAAITSREVAARCAGVRPAEIEELIQELNAEYAEEERPFRIVSAGAGYRLVLHEEWAGLSHRFHGRIKEARLSQAAVDVLAIVAYNQGITREEVDRLRDKPSGGLLSQLVRRQLIRLERTDTKPRQRTYYTTERFLQLFHLESLEELPQAIE